MSVSREVTRITLPENAERCDQLAAKLEEYDERWSFTAPEVLAMYHPLQLYKREILEQLLKNKEVDIKKLYGELREKYPTTFHPEAFESAARTIEDYVLTGGTNVSGGTGLRRTEPVTLT